MASDTATGDQELVYAGIAQQTCTPPLGIRLAGALRDGPCEAVADELTVTVLYLQQGPLPVVIVACDLILLPPEDATSMRDEMADALGFTRDQVLLSVSHSHATPSPPSWGEYDNESTDHERRTVADYFAQLQHAMRGAALQAKGRAAPCRVAVGHGHCDINVNRREVQPDGRTVLGCNTDGPADKDVIVVRIDHDDGRPLATVFNYACHPDVLGPKASVISSDFVGPARDTIASVTGAPSLFLQGAAGDLYPRTGIVDPPDGLDQARRQGNQLGAEVSRIHQRLHTTRQPAQRHAWESTASVTTHWSYQDKPGSVPRLGVLTRHLSMPMRALPSRVEAEEQLARRQSDIAHLNGDAALSTRLITHRRAAWARVQLDAVRNRTPPRMTVELQVVQLGELALVAIPGELFTEIGSAIKAASPFPHTLVAAYSNGVLFYIPTREAFTQGGYEINSHQNYLRPAGPTVEWEDLLVTGAQALLTELYEGASVSPVPPQSLRDRTHETEPL